jgi:hypothetical protein
MNWLKRKLRNWLHSDQKVEAAGLSHDNPLVFMLGQSSDRHYITIPVENGFALITRTVEDHHSPYKSNGPRATVTFCPSAEDLGQTIIAKMAHHKLTAR